MKNALTLLTALLASTAAGQSLEMTDLETRVIAREEGRWFGRARLLVIGSC